MIMHSRTFSGLSLAKSVAAYTLLPDFWSRLVAFIPRFGMIAYFMALIFQSIKLIPNGHPLLESSRMGQCRIRDVLAVAANHLHGGFRNSDHYIIFGIFLIGIILLGLQFVFLAAIIIVHPADAAVPFVGMFVTLFPETDIAHLMLDRVFGIPGFFKSCFDPAVNAAQSSDCVGYIASTSFPTPLQQAMQTLFRFYSMGILVVAGFVLVYYIIAMILETVNTGVPFGKRFQSIYSPLRLVMAVLLLLPLAYGYNTGQYMVLNAAKWGSGLATNAWWLFNNKVGDNPMGMTPRELIGVPKVQDIESIVNFFYLVRTCQASYKLSLNKDIQPYLVKPASATTSASAQALGGGLSFPEARNFYGGGDVRIVFGEFNANYADATAYVRPYCGVLTIPSLSQDVQGISSVYNTYFSNIQNIWESADMAAYGMRMACISGFSEKCTAMPTTSVDWDAPYTAPAGQGFYIAMREGFQSIYAGQMLAEINTIRSTTNPALAMDSRIMLAGWGGAGLWFDKVVAFNGAFVDSLMNLPTPTQYPLIMEHVAKKRKMLEPNVPKRDRFSLVTKSGTEGDERSLDKQLDDSGLGDTSAHVAIAKVLSTVYQQVQDSDATAKPKTVGTDSPIKNFVSYLFGQTGLFDFRANSEVFPLAKLAILGREILNKTVIMIAATTVMSGLGGMVGSDLGALGDVIGNMGPALKSYATIGITVGVLLYYFVPFMPFVYFFFAVGRWVKSIFEAMVAIPLWALAHMRLGGEGIPGPAAGQGYFLILEIFLRPILTLFGLLASMGTFMALSAGLDSVFNLAVVNIGGFDMTTLSSTSTGGGANIFLTSVRDGVDALFYTVLYAILVYMIATSSFKLIDLFPNAIMRWGGTNVAGFNDGADPIGQLEYNLVYKVDSTARELAQVGDNFSDQARLREMFKS